jgi:hypothetical protein
MWGRPKPAELIRLKIGYPIHPVVLPSCAPSAQFVGLPRFGLDKAIYSTSGQQYPIGNRLVGHKAPVFFSHAAHYPLNSNVAMIEIVLPHLVRWSHILSTLSSHRSSRRCVLMPIDMPGQQFQESPCHDLTLTSHNVSSALTTENRYKQPDSNDLKDWSTVRGWSTRVQSSTNLVWITD